MSRSAPHYQSTASTSDAPRPAHRPVAAARRADAADEPRATAPASTALSQADGEP